ncbi:GNAT family N-acetyltransferase [Arthrobacter sp. CAN_C5]|uniref:GNAT family N-acetyltransferase n=1 Tax=Arthrobacter sp. CAN_C5 TaxID=2760706 RepID=UPI001AE79331|nr:GNAT family N-acetyltransferase [Arthrobacter sp. CAN_C5]MBP2217059.1 GNAT superfamily N-acetyltransferase [Arthrobacter sp. CAN_C5]
MTAPTSITKVATIEECDAIRALVEAHIDYERSNVILPVDWADKTVQFIGAGRMTIFVAHAGSGPVGYASITTDVATWKGEPFAHLDCLYVSGTYRGAGIGRLLLDSVATDARARGYGELQWQTPAWNTRAIQFYERVGATHQPKERFTLELPLA